MTANLPRYFLPSDKPKPNPARSFARAAFAVGKNALDHAGKRKGAHVLAEERWPMDRAALALTKAAVSPATMTNTSVLSPSVTADFVASLAFDSAAAKLIDLGMRIDMSGVSSVLIPHRSTNLPDVNAQWIGETNSFPVRQYTLAASTLGPVHKLASSVVLSREMSEAAGGEEVFSTLLREDLAASLDSSMFSATAASAVRPAGLLAGVSALTATAGGGAGALQGDIAALASVAYLPARRAPPAFPLARVAGGAYQLFPSRCASAWGRASTRFLSSGWARTLLRSSRVFSISYREAPASRDRFLSPGWLF